jgi:ABC-type transport system substrate-binding protein
MGKWSMQVKDLPPDIQQWYKYNPTEAKKLLEAAGQTNLQLKLAYLVNSPGLAGPALTIKKAETLANMLGAVGIKVNLITQDYNKDFIDAGKGGRQGYFDKDTMIFAGVPSFTEADEFLWGNFHSKSTSPPEKLSDPTVDAMLDRVRTIVNEDDRLKAVLDFQRYIADKMYVVSTPDTYAWTVIQPRVQNYQYSSTLGRYTEAYAKLWLRT